MELDPLIRAGSEAIAIAKDVVKALALPAANEVGQMWADSVRTRRLVRLVALSRKAEREFRLRGVDPRQVPDSFGIPFLNTATLTEDEDLQRRWAALLVTSSDPKNESLHATAFVHVLGQLAPFEATLLEWAEDFRREVSAPTSEDDPELDAVTNLANQRGPDWSEVSAAFPDLIEARFAEVAVNLERLGLVVAGAHLVPTRFGMSRTEGKSYTSISLTPFGRSFVRGCRPSPLGPSEL